MTDHVKAAITRLQDSADDIIGWLSDFQEHAPYGNDEAITFHRLNGSIDLRHAIEEIIPHIRAMVAEEIEDHIGRVFGGRPNSSLTTSEMIAKTSSKIAAQIALGAPRD